ncbi:RNA-binding S4 domain-containing protein [Parerythrobacter jejuensis]|uniref:RNA-binding S4 domain-containing protein n=1 Tax=Parerythrobacter jejuensis TaxID=795812 RepID=A0A845AP24_9SPHN|nr:S4 domain-containing protein [Parerythrobacter jejuensis]MXP30923.1 RNA-binding S4 domain-containing protein [Parerythrobacter jejuensis]MXP33683.1 RNA-binding S4 domain-containing protein [Parerythrobacter jejuensis]
MRLDLVLCRLRIVKTRSIARALAESGHMRINSRRVQSGSHPVETEDVLTIPQGQAAIVIEILRLPERRGPASEAQSCYRKLDP